MSLNARGIALQGLLLTPLAMALHGLVGVIDEPIESPAPADRFPYGSHFSPALQGRYTADPVIGRMALRQRKPRRW